MLPILDHFGRRFVRGFVVVALATGYFSYVFRVQDGTLGSSGLGNWLDAYFINALLEHWRHSLWHLQNPISPPMFFPARDTLGYSHSLMLYAPLYTVLRLFVDPFPAHNLTIFAVLLGGSVCLYVILRRHFGLGWVESLVLTAFFCTSPNVINSGMAQWSQTASVFLIPPTLLLGLTALRMPSRRGRAATALLTGFLTISIVTQEFYTGAFMFLCAALLLPGFVRRPADLLRRSIRSMTPARLEPGHPSRIWLIVGGVLLIWAVVVRLHPFERMQIASLKISARDPLKPFRVAMLALAWFAARRWRLATRIRQIGEATTRALGHLRLFDVSLCLGMLVGGVVFAIIYAKSYSEHPTFPPDHLLNQLRQPNPAGWHDFREMARDLVNYGSARPFAFVALAAVLLWIPPLNPERRFKREAAWCLFVAAVVLAIPLKYHEQSFWHTVFGRLPGLTAIRDPKRIIYLYELTVVLTAAWCARAFAPRSVLRTGLIVIVLALMAADWNHETFKFDRSGSVFRQWVTAPIAVDRSCRSFFMKPASDTYQSRSDNMFGQYSIDALFIAIAHDVPTLNGYSAWFPPEWRMAHPNDADYPQLVADWIERNQLHDVCVLDIDRRTMTRVN